MNNKTYFFTLKAWQFNLTYALFILLAFNYPFLRRLYEINNSLFMTITGFITVLGLLQLILSLLFATPRLAKIIGIPLILIGSIVFYFMSAYNILIDKVMLLNVIRTDIYEAGDLFRPMLLLFFMLLGILPSYLIYKTRILPENFRSRLYPALPALLLSALIIAPNFATFKDILRNHKELRYSLIPSNYIGSVIGVGKMYDELIRPFTDIGLDAKAHPYWNNTKKNLFVFVVGETARAANFSLGGYSRDTAAPLRPYLSEIIYYPEFYACGTSTAVSVPCMFSKDGRKDFQPGSELNTANLIDIFSKVGYHGLWRDNNTSCQDNCNRIELEVPCTRKSCLDDVLLTGLEQKIRHINQDTFLILHQRGSHGPDYTGRYPADWQAPYLPACGSADLKSCPPQELINAYDNSVYYGNIFLQKTIDILKSLADEYNTVLVYASDHGESLGEDGLFLHSMPYDTAPDVQKHIPALIWIASQTARDFGLDMQCLRRHAQQYHSHDNLFHSFLGLAGISVSEYNSSLDIFAPCRK